MKARLLVTMVCNRKCEGCCNAYESVMSGLRTVYNLDSLIDYNEVMITGGEPMLDPSRTRCIILAIKKQNPSIKIFLYTAYAKRLDLVVNVVDGIHFTLHEGATEKDVQGFYDFQTLAANYPEKSFRAYIDSRVTEPVYIQPNVFHRLEIKSWVAEGYCPIPEDDLLALDPEYEVSTEVILV